MSAQWKVAELRFRCAALRLHGAYPAYVLGTREGQVWDVASAGPKPKSRASPCGMGTADLFTITGFVFARQAADGR